ncbi:hypothetical protein GHT06_020420 [Daphnia sinensis]|uniref:Uncharacterized protein n=1 Tax=Daphnia sinensis TaxID=1820382 RepID=A0AAD5KYM9_9CRUS|nr:hypothetical protein GHT06_020420 [Daphnia sinensis]
MSTKLRPPTFEPITEIRLGEFHAQVKFSPQKLKPTPSRLYQPLPPGVNIDEKLVFYETGSIMWPSQQQQVGFVEEEPIYPHIPLPSGQLVPPTPTPTPRLIPPQLRSLHPAEYREIPPQQVRPVRNVIVSHLFSTKSGVPEEDKKKVKVAIEERATGHVVTVKKKEEDEIVPLVL